MKKNGSVPYTKGSSLLNVSHDYELALATNEQVLELKNWFSSQQQILTWGGPNLVYPVADDDFIIILRAPHLNSYCVTDSAKHLLAFGQYYLRLDRYHLGRLAVNPHYRNQGIAKILIAGLLEKAVKNSKPREASLFVFKDNVAALHCYQNMGFREETYPEAMPENMPNCVYMVLR